MNTTKSIAAEAIDLMNRTYLPHIKKLLDTEERCGHCTITLNRSELQILQLLVTNRLDEIHRDWYEKTHDDTYTDPQELAYVLSRTECSFRQLSKLYTLLNHAKED